MPKPSTRAAAHPPTGNGPTPLRGAVQKKVIKRQIIPITANITRCELTSPVLKVASRSQDLIFSGASLFFTKAVFKVPSTEEEALDTMRTGTSDVDKDLPDGSPINDLYFLSWSHTQFFAAQMAALGYRFLSSNLSRRAQKTKPPAVSEWLRLEKYHTVPRRMVQAGAPVQKISAAAAGQGSVAPLGTHIRPASHSQMVAAAAPPNQNGVPPPSGRGLADTAIMKATPQGRLSNSSTSQQPSNPASSKPASNMTSSPEAPSHAPSAMASLPSGKVPDANDVQVIDLT
ncbi:unnamed protein product [Chondrus crispus]|uniref:Uncharacterized protein n=1 Tax=Chondrus crispus TaxID=2769 RepID=R7QA82_CHOCR|nr:unnamed protein product [Chondrus crispus]CDF34688.1 unnamed protein product [Chondrus crispus]|eukprot:XP_005714507.1 unnamed protein product [Chondrus crispus]